MVKGLILMTKVEFKMSDRMPSLFFPEIYNGKRFYSRGPSRIVQGWVLNVGQNARAYISQKIYNGKRF